MARSNKMRGRSLRANSCLVCNGSLSEGGLHVEHMPNSRDCFRPGRVTSPAHEEMWFCSNHCFGYWKKEGKPDVWGDWGRTRRDVVNDKRISDSMEDLKFAQQLAVEAIDDDKEMVCNVLTDEECREITEAFESNMEIIGGMAEYIDELEDERDRFEKKVEKYEKPSVWQRLKPW